MTKDKDRKQKVFIKKSTNLSGDEKDEFYEYDRAKSKSVTVDEDFFENIQSVDYEKLRLEKERAQMLEIENENKLEHSEKVESIENIEDEIFQNESINSDFGFVESNKEKKEEIVTESKNILFDEDDDDFSSFEEYDKSKISESNVDTTENQKSNIFTDYGINEEISQENDKYASLFETQSQQIKGQDVDDADSRMRSTSVINIVNSKENNFSNENNNSPVYDEDDDFGSVEDYTESVSPKSYSNDYENISQKADYYNDFNNDELSDEEDEDEYYTDKKGRKRKKRRTLRIFLKVFLLLLISCSAMAVYFGLTHDLFKIDYIAVNGNVHNDKDIIILKSGVNIGDNIFLTRASKIEKNLKENPTIESVKVTKDYPNILNIEVKENYVSAYINASNGITTIDNLGKIKQIGAGNSETSGIQIKGLSDSKNTVGEDFSKDVIKVKLLLEILTKDYYNDVSTIDFSNDKEIIIEMKDSLKITFGDLNDYAKKTKIIDVMLKKIKSDAISASELILNVGNNPIIVKK